MIRVSGLSVLERRHTCWKRPLNVPLCTDLSRLMPEVKSSSFVAAEFWAEPVRRHCYHYEKCQGPSPTSFPTYSIEIFLPIYSNGVGFIEWHLHWVSLSNHQYSVLLSVKMGKKLNEMWPYTLMLICLRVIIMCKSRKRWLLRTLGWLIHIKHWAGCSALLCSGIYKAFWQFWAQEVAFKTLM